MRDDRVYLLHIRDAIERILVYTREGREAFFADPRTQDAVVRNIEVVGEAVKSVSQSLRQGHPQIPWTRIAGMRDKLIHEYFGVDLNLVWDAVQRDIPRLRDEVQKILDGLDRDGAPS